MDLIFASNNEHKALEIQAGIGNLYNIITLKQAGINIEIPEPYATLEANASHKAKTIFELTGKNCFSEDTGLEVQVLNGKPGVKSARYAEQEPQYKDNNEKLLHALQNEFNRVARFRTIISLWVSKEEYFFEGICEGSISYQCSGTNGFGYDPLFIPAGSLKTFGQMTREEKAGYSHRKQATDKMVVFLQQLFINN